MVPPMDDIVSMSLAAFLAQPGETDHGARSNSQIDNSKTGPGWLGSEPARW